MRRIQLILAILILVSVTHQANAEIKVSGFGQAQIVYDTANADKELYFNIKRARAIVKGNVIDKIGIFSQLEMFTAAINILDLVIDYDLGVVGKIGIGRFTKPFGLQNPVAPYNLHTINYAQVVSNLIGSGGRDFGLRLTGKYKIIDWTLAGVNGSDGGTTVIAATEDNNAKDIIGRIGFSLPFGLGLGTSFYTGKAGAPKNVRDRIGLDVKYEKGSIYTQAECIAGQDGSLKKSGLYIEAGYKINNFQPIVRCDVYDGNTEQEDATEIIIIAGGLNYYFSDSAKIQFIYEYKKDKVAAGLTDSNNDICIIQTAVKF